MRKGEVARNVLDVCDMKGDFVFVLFEWEEITNANILDDVNEGDSNYAITGGEDINYIEASNEWTQWRDNLAEVIFSGCLSRNPKHLWTKAKKSCLVDCLMNLVNVGGGGWRSDNGTFKLDYLAQLMRMMGEKMPGTACSGFSWKDELKCIIAENDVFDSWVRIKNSKGLLNKPFPYYDELSYVFGKDHAMGARAKTFADIESNVLDKSDRVQAEDGLDIEFPTMCSPMTSLGSSRNDRR
ncbi:retrotransposon protein [Cucumis melo var. makuwa]|uniref:Retrotransposon protein n=2 Tax=Cucumis melo TaxID=3656 RepID=A0A5D3D9Y6_CUCMM|nr:retrotransposon protein [Cucumis melo var. makuwa]